MNNVFKDTDQVDYIKDPHMSSRSEETEIFEKGVIRNCKQEPIILMDKSTFEQLVRIKYRMSDTSSGRDAIVRRYRGLRSMSNDIGEYRICGKDFTYYTQYEVDDIIRSEWVRILRKVCDKYESKRVRNGEITRPFFPKTIQGLTPIAIYTILSMYTKLPVTKEMVDIVSNHEGENGYYEKCGEGKSISIRNRSVDEIASHIAALDSDEEGIMAYDFSYDIDINKVSLCKESNIMSSPKPRDVIVVDGITRYDVVKVRKNTILSSILYKIIRGLNHMLNSTGYDTIGQRHKYLSSGPYYILAPYTIGDYTDDEKNEIEKGIVKDCKDSVVNRSDNWIDIEVVDKSKNPISIFDL